jgi:soluble lytic murein transglycosylase
MPSNRFKYHSLFSLLILSTCMTAAIRPVNAETLEEYRKHYNSAKSALRAGELTKFRTLSASLVDYPLYPYLQYDYLRPRLASSKNEELAEFIGQYNDSPVASDLRTAWLKLLAQRGHWQVFLDNYTPQQDATLQCQQLIARIKTGNSDGLLEDIKRMWLVGKSQPDQCDPAFELLYKSDLMTPELVWQRIQLAIHNNQTGLAGYIARRLGKQEQKWVTDLIAAHQNPASITRDPRYEDTVPAREILSHAITRLAVSDINTAVTRWDTLKPAYTFTPEQISNVERILAVRASLRKHPRSGELLDNFENQSINEELFHWRLRNVLENHDWPTLVKWTEGKPADESIRLRWLYWRARALEQTGNSQAATEIYSELARERDYYGFLAADRISAPYNLNHNALPYDAEMWHSVNEMGGVKRARELHLTGSLYPARREWNHLLNNITPYQMQLAAAIAAEWGWHDRAILTLGRAQAYDDLVLRFPVVYEDQLKKYADMRNLDLGWVFALTRAESAFMADARSPAGALGLMQVMPATGAETAKSIGLNNFESNQLLNADNNITIGTAYLKKVHDRFGNRILATAAYNAGPGAVSRWLTQDSCAEPDIWVEKIPFAETRKYVARIMFFATVYDWRLNHEMTRVSERMEPIVPRSQNLVADLSCSAPNISQL